MVYVVMGVSGCGKTTVGRMLAEKLGIKFYDADDYHPQENIDKMRSLVPLTDEDRIPWLFELAHLIVQWNKGEGAVLACSALKERYREILSGDRQEMVAFIYLEGDEDLILSRMSTRRRHFFSSSLLGSQFNDLEISSNMLTVKTDKSLRKICKDVIDKLASKGFLAPVGSQKPTNLLRRC